MKHRIHDSHLLDLTDEQRVDLWRAMRAGDPGARDRLIAGGLLFANRFAGRYANTVERRATDEAMDAYVSAARLGLIDAVDSWDPARGKFFAHAVWRMRYHLWRERLARKRAARMASLEALEIDVGGDVVPQDALADRMDARDACGAVMDGVRAMVGPHAMMRETVLHYHGLDGRECLDQPTLAARQGVSRHAVSKRYVKSLRHLRAYLESRGITDASL